MAHKFPICMSAINSKGIKTTTNQKKTTPKIDNKKKKPKIPVENFGRARIKWLNKLEEEKEIERERRRVRQRRIDKLFFFIFLEEENKKFPCLKALNIQFRYLKMFSTITTTQPKRER